MKKITNFIKDNTKLIAALVLGITISGGSVYAATILMNADQVGFDKTGTSLSSTDVQGALDELYQRTKILDSLNLMQTFKKSSLANTGDSATLMDARDGNTYTVKKLADGNVWMTENLRIVNKTITSADSNVSSDFTIPASSISGFNAQDTNNAYVDSTYSTYGGYYTFYTATAGTGGTSLTSGNAPSDICPKGWRLPTGGSSGEFQTLYDNYNSFALMQGDPGFILPGYIRNGGWGGPRGEYGYGYYLSSTVVDANKANAMFMDVSGVWPAVSGGDKYNGYSVRCIAI